MTFLEGLLDQFPYLAIFLFLLLCGLGAPLAEEPAILVGGYLAYQGTTHWLVTIVVCIAGILVGDTLLFLIGRRYGRRLFLVRPFRRLLRPRRRQKVQHYLDKYGSKAVFVARFLPGVRAATYFTVGHLRMPLGRFLFWDGLAAVLSVPVAVWIGWFAGENMPRARGLLARVDLLLGLALAIGIAAWLWIRRRRAAPPPPSA